MNNARQRQFDVHDQAVQLASRVRNNVGDGAVRPSIELGEAGSLYLTRPRLADHLPDAATVIRQRIEQVYAQQSVLGEDGASHSVLPIAVTPERGAFIADLCRAERPSATLEIGMAWGLSTLHILAALAEVNHRAVLVEGLTQGLEGLIQLDVVFVALFRGAM